MADDEGFAKVIRCAAHMTKDEGVENESPVNSAFQSERNNESQKKRDGGYYIRWHLGWRNMLAAQWNYRLDGRLTRFISKDMTGQ